MISYTELYEILRKEKYSEVLQLLPKSFMDEIGAYLNDKKEESSKEEDIFGEGIAKSKKQLENSVALFKELMLRRKKKLLNLVFVAAETGIMKRDYENMLHFEKETFEKLVKAFEECDKDIARSLNGRREPENDKNKMVVFNQNIEQFVDMSGNLVGPFSSGMLANLNSDVSQVLVSSGKARFVDE